MLVLDPVTSYFFKHLEDDGLMHYAESVGMLTPERKSGMLSGSASFSASHSGVLRSQSCEKKSTDGFDTSQVGLYFDTSPVPLRPEPTGLKRSTMDGSARRIPTSHFAPAFPGMMSMKSVHFDLSDNEIQGISFSEVASDCRNDVGYSLSASELFVLDPHRPEMEKQEATHTSKLQTSVGRGHLSAHAPL